MATLICPHCSHILESEAPPLGQCPSCGRTFSNDLDATRSADGRVFPLCLEQEELHDKIGRFPLIAELGSGGFGTVWLAQDPMLRRLVALKIPRRDGMGGRFDQSSRFAREARNAAQLHHPGIVSVYNVENDGDLTFIVAEYVEGEPLHRYAQKTAISFRTAASLAAAVAWAVDYAHSKGIIHRDIKPANIMIDAGGNPRLMDFGLAKSEVLDETITADHQFAGTPPFMSPEQAWGKPDQIDRRTDIYSLGALLYNLLTREYPFRGDVHVIRRRVIEEEPKRPRTINDQIPLDLETICVKAMEKEPAKRYRTAGELAADLERWLRGEPILARHIGVPERLWRWFRRNPLAAGLVASIGLLVLTVACGATLMYATEHQAKTRIEAALGENRALLSKSYVERANRHLGPEGFVEEYSPNKAFPLLCAALQLDENDPARRDASRLRLGAALRGAPAVEKLWSHGGRILAAAFAPSKNRFFTCGDDGRGRIWTMDHEQPAPAILIHPAAVKSADFSPDGKFLLTGCGDGTARLWDVESGKLVGGPFRDDESGQPAPPPKMPANGVFTVSFSRTGRYFVGFAGRTARVWETATGKFVGARFVSPASLVGSAAFTRDERTLLIAGTDGSLSAVDVPSGKEAHRLAPRSNDVVPPPAIAPAANLVAGAINAKSVVLWNWESGKRLETPELVHDTAVTALHFADGGRALAAGTKDGVLYLWRTADGQLIWKRRISAGEIHQLDPNARGNQLAVTTVGVDGLSVVDVESGNFAAEPMILPRAIVSSKWAEETGMLISATRDGIVRCWRPEGQEPAFLLPHSQRLCCGAFSADRRVVATIDKEDVCCVLTSGDNRSFEPSDARRFSPGLHEAVGLALSADGSKLAVADRNSTHAKADGSKLAVAVQNSTFALFDLAQGGNKYLARIATSAPLLALAFTSSGRRLVTFAQDGVAAVWDTENGERVRQEQFEANRMAQLIGIERQGDLWVIGRGHHFVVWDPLTGNRRGPQVAHESPFCACRLSPDGRFVLTASLDWTARVWVVATGKLVASTPRLTWITGLAFSFDGSRFATACNDGTVRIWRTADAQPITGVLPHGRSIDDLFFSPDARWLVTSSFEPRDQTNGDAVVRVWDASTGECILVQALSRFAGRFPTSPDRIVVDPWGIASILLSSDGHRLHVTTRGGLFATYDLSPDSRRERELLDEVAVRSGTLPDSNGDLLLLEPSRLMSSWRSLHP